MYFDITKTPKKLNLAKEPAWLVLQFNDSAPATHDLRIVLQIYMKLDSEGSYTVYYAEAVGNDSGLVKFNLTPLVDEYLGNSFTEITPFGTSYHSMVSDATVWMLIKATEFVDGILTDVYPVIMSDEEYPFDDFLFYHGGLTHNKRSTGIDYFDWKASKAPLRPFNSWRENKRITDLFAPQPLYYTRHGRTGKMHILIKVYGPYSSGYPLWVNIKPELFDGSSDCYLPFAINASWSALDIAALVTAASRDPLQVSHYTIQIADESFTGISELITFYIDRKYYSNVNYIVYQNGIGGYECLRLTGNEISRAEYERSVSAMSRNVTQPVDGLRKTFSTSEREIIKISTQYFGIEQMQQLREVMLSPRTYLVRDNYLHPIEPVEKNKDFTDTMKQLQSNTIEFRFCEDNSVWMPSNSFL